MPVYHKPNFEPSQHSLGCEYGDLALTNRGAVAVTAKTTKFVGTAVFTGGWSLGVEALKGKNARYAEATGEADKWKLRYEKCAEKRRQKGKSVFPNNPGKGPFFTDCREKYKEYKHYLNKASDIAKQLQNGLESKGLATEESDAILIPAIAAPAEIEKEEFEKTMQDWKNRSGKKGGGARNKPNRANSMNAAFDPEGTALTLEGDGDDGFPIWILGIGALLALGGVGYYVMSSSGEDELDEADATE